MQTVENGAEILQQLAGALGVVDSEKSEEMKKVLQKDHDNYLKKLEQIERDIIYYDRYTNDSVRNWSSSGGYLLDAVKKEKTLLKKQMDKQIKFYEKKYK